MEIIRLCDYLMMSFRCQPKYAQRGHFQNYLKKFTILGTQGRPPPKMPQWHIDYFEVKLLKKELIQEGHSDPPLCLPENRELISHVKGSLPGSGSRRTPLSPEAGNLELRSPYKQTLLLLSLTPPKPKLCLDSSLIKQPKPKFLCLVNSSQIYCFFV